MNTLVHIIRFCAQESVTHAQKEHKVNLGLNDKSLTLKLVCTIRLNAKSLKLKIGVYIIRQNSRNLHDCKLMF